MGTGILMKCNDKHRKSIRLYPAVVVAFVSLSAQVCFGWADSWDDLKAAAGRISSVSAAFVQEKHMKILAKPLISEGLLYFQTPNSLRWEYQRPIQSILIAHAGETKKFIRKNGRVIVDAAANAPAMQFVVDEISRWLKGRFDENPLFSARLVPGRKIVLIPADKGLADIIQRIELELSPRPGILESVMVYESKDAYTRIVFTHAEINLSLDRRLFEDVP